MIFVGASPFKQTFHEVSFQQAQLGEVLLDALFDNNIHGLAHILVLDVCEDLVVIDKLL